MTTYDDLPPYLPAFPGPLRDRLVAAVLSGAKTPTAGSLASYGAEGEPLPRAGQRTALMDSAGCPVAVLGVTDVRVLRLGGVDLGHAPAEGEGCASVAEWRASHRPVPASFRRGRPGSARSAGVGSVGRGRRSGPGSAQWAGVGAAGRAQPTALAAARPAARPEKMQPPRKVPSRAR
ncbi:ASCH domain-containing protein [Streptomyces sp. NPDC059989]|uniref:ASCH domain-containing protein n=1 Tax=Streptomyces sp. NPDC059989 TaxID=3347026 RepID=UPI0036BB18DC